MLHFDERGAWCEVEARGVEVALLCKVQDALVQCLLCVCVFVGGFEVTLLCEVQDVLVQCLLQKQRSFRTSLCEARTAQRLPPVLSHLKVHSSRQAPRLGWAFTAAASAGFRGVVRAQTNFQLLALALLAGCCRVLVGSRAFRIRV